MHLTRRRQLLALLVAAILGLITSGVLMYRAVTVEQASSSQALQRFSAIRSALGDAAPLLTIDDAGNVVRRAEPASTMPRPLKRLRVLAYQASEERLVSAEVPFWFFRLKGAAAQYMVRGTGLDLERLHITAADLARYDPSVVIDHLRSNGDRLLVWTE